MARRALLTPLERAQILGLPDDDEGIALLCTVDEADISLIRQQRGDPDLLGFALQFALLRGPGIALGPGRAIPDAVIARMASNLAVAPTVWAEYSSREETMQEHAREARVYLGLASFGMSAFRGLVDKIDLVAAHTDRGRMLVEAAIASLRRAGIALPAVEVFESARAQGLTRANRHLHTVLSEPLNAA